MSLLTLFEDDDDMAIPVVTWATLPSAAGSTGKRYRVSDVGPSGSDWISNGTMWVPVQGIVTIARSAVQASVTGTVSETALATITLPAGLMGTNGQLRITTLWSNNNNGNNKAMRVRFGGISGTVYLIVVNTANVITQAYTHIRNRNSASSQIGYTTTSAPFGVSANSNTTSSVDTSAETTISITAALANSGDSAALESYTVELIR